jgi:hypothetical protein
VAFRQDLGGRKGNGMKRPLLIPLLLAACAAPPPARPLRDEPKLFNYDEARVPPYALPDPLRFADGRPVRSPADWRARRAELLRLFEEHVYGKAPGAAPGLRVLPRSEVRDALGGRATRRELTILFDGREDGPRMELMVFLPNGRPGPSPVFAGLNFSGNHAVHPDPGIRLTDSWMRKAPDNRASDEGRGKDAKAWPIEAAIGRGYAVATAYYGDVDPDFDDGFRNGVHALTGPPGPGEWAALAAWSWGLRRMVDALVAMKEVDAARIVALGHSRLGKAALWAAAQDERIAIAVSNNSGKGGASLWRRDYGETAAWAVKQEPHRFAGNFRRYGPDPDALPVDAHLLLALIAPRPVYVASATEDRWADPRGEFLAAMAAEPAYALHGKRGLGVESPPPPDISVGDAIGYHLRTGPHAITAWDWERYLDFADRHFAR